MLAFLGTVAAVIGAAVLGDRAGNRIYDWWHVG